MAVLPVRAQAAVERLKLASRRPLISVIIPVLNDAGALQTLLPTLNGLLENFAELIVCDGGSSDNSVEVARTLADKVTSSSPGRAIQMNLAAKAANGSMLWFVHADTVVEQHVVESLLDTARADTNNSAWGRFDISIGGSDPSSTRPSFRLIGTMMNWRSRLTAVATGDQAIFVARELFESIGGYSDIPLMEDIELSKRLRNYSPPVCHKERVVTSARRWLNHGVGRTLIKMWLLRLAYFLGVSPHRLVRWYYPSLAKASIRRV